jgi:hypothetical protein
VPPVKRLGVVNEQDITLFLRGHLEACIVSRRRDEVGKNNTVVTQ